MNWSKFTLIAYFALNLIVAIAVIGRKREPITPSTVLFSLPIYSYLTYLVVQL